VALIFLSYFHGYNKIEIFIVQQICRFISSTKKKIEHFYLIFLLNNVLVNCSANFGAPGIVYLFKFASSTIKPTSRHWCTVCDQAAMNVRALQLLKLDSNTHPTKPYFKVNFKKIVCLFDVPHLLKSLRNALLKYTVYYGETKKAKFTYLRQAYEFDKSRRFQILRKIRECFLYVNRHTLLKMKVSIAAKTLSSTMAAAIETLVDCGKNIPSEAIETACFIQDVNNLFDSFNSTGIRVNKYNPPYRCALTKNSFHWQFWESMKEKIKSWQFYDETTGQTKSTMPFKHGWLNNIEGIKLIWHICNEIGFKFLRTRMLNQDPLENVFSIIRQYGAANVNPTCFQFISALKTSILHNLVGYKSYGENCEDDASHLLDNLRHFLSVDKLKVKSKILEENENELLSCNVSVVENNMTFNDKFDLQAVSYVGGFLISKFKNDCDECQKCLFAQNTDVQHIFTLYKEHDKSKLKLKYITEELCVCVAKIYDLSVYYLNKFGEVNYIGKKLRIALERKINFSWFTCTSHFLDIKTKLLDAAINLIIY
jgi:hypothetical protein